MDNNELYDILLQKFFEESLKPDANMKLLEFYLEELEKLNPSEELSSTEMLEDYHKLMLKVKEGKSKKIFRVVLPKLAVVCAFSLVIILGMNTMGYATFGFNLLNILSHNDTKRIEMNAQDTIDDTGFWIPEGYQLIKQFSDVNAARRQTNYIFSNSNHEITFQIVVFKDYEKMINSYKDDNEIEKIVIDNHIYYVDSDDNVMQIVWYSFNKTYTLSAKDATSETREILTNLLYDLPDNYKSTID